MPVTGNVNSLNIKQCQAKSKQFRKGYLMILDPQRALMQRLQTVLTQTRYLLIEYISKARNCISNAKLNKLRNIVIG